MLAIPAAVAAAAILLTRRGSEAAAFAQSGAVRS